MWVGGLQGWRARPAYDNSKYPKNSLYLLYVYQSSPQFLNRQEKGNCCHHDGHQSPRWCRMLMPRHDLLDGEPVPVVVINRSLPSPGTSWVRWAARSRGGSSVRKWRYREQSSAQLSGSSRLRTLSFSRSIPCRGRDCFLCSFSLLCHCLG